jgi:hypothetical protein
LIADLLIPNTASDTTARRVVSYLAEKGIGRAAICDTQLRPLYAALSRSVYSPLGAGIARPGLNSNNTPVGDAVWGVIVETREHPALEYVVCQFSKQLNVGIQLFHGTANRSFIQDSKIQALVEQGKVILTALETEMLSPVGYNALFLSEDFWNALLGRKKILVFQTDAILCSKSDYQLADFLDYDYIGSKWPRKRPVGMLMDGGNGGLSLRDWRRSVACLDRFSPDLWPGGEDGYFSFHIDVLGGRVGRGNECAQFSTQKEFLFKSLGGHKITELDSATLKRFIQYCPEVNLVL